MCIRDRNGGKTVHWMIAFQSQVIMCASAVLIMHGFVNCWDTTHAFIMEVFQGLNVAFRDLCGALSKGVQALWSACKVSSLVQLAVLLMFLGAVPGSLEPNNVYGVVRPVRADADR
eukprot:TRINITY_DN1811_c0_g1_i2.p1 TRINITY_DN1811_c0_g1~~TRINITY_DN1811_c0_g1_i2.p1  ORF type:complete len:116 (-),score=0.65 TRINITY_DN1811_c0_g1_i2:258-605(-)